MKNFFFLIAAVAIFTSCRTVKKVTDTRKETVEEITQTVEDSAGVKTSITNSVVVTDEEDSSSVEIWFDTTDNSNPLKPEDYLSIDTAGNIVIKGRIDKIKAKTGTKTVKKDSTTIATRDTASKRTEQTVEKKHTTEEKHSTTDRKGIFSIAFWPVFAAAIVIFILLYLKRQKDKKAESIINK